MFDDITIEPQPPRGLQWRSSVWFATLVVGFGLLTDITVYSIIIPVLPFRLEALGYSGVSSLVGWLLFAFSGGLVVSTIPIAMFSERYKTRRMPLIIGLVGLLGSQVMLMEAPNYGVMCLARVLQGISSSVVWIVGLALLCDSVPENRVGRQLGMAMTGTSIGFVIGPPVGGILYGRLGYRAPFIFAEICTILDLVGRLLIIERKDALGWRVNPDAISAGKHAEEEHVSNDIDIADGQLDEKDQSTSSGPLVLNALPEKPKEGEVEPLPDTEQAEAVIIVPIKPLSFHVMVIRLMKSSRALVALGLSFVWGLAYSGQETTLPLHLQAAWNLDSTKVGLVLLAAVVPTVISSPLTGWLADKGTEWVTVLSLLLAIPWWVVIIVQSSLPLFIVAFAIETFFSSGVMPPVIAELAAVSRNVDGMPTSMAHFNLAYGMGTTIGPIISGEVYQHIKHGWTAICLLATGLITLCLLFSFGYTGADPLAARFQHSISKRNAISAESNAATAPSSPALVE